MLAAQVGASFQQRGPLMCDRSPAHHGLRSSGFSLNRQNCLSLSLGKNISKYEDVSSWRTTPVLVCWEMGRAWYCHTCRGSDSLHVALPVCLPLTTSLCGGPEGAAATHQLSTSPSCCLRGLEAIFAGCKQKCPRDRSCRHGGWGSLREEHTTGPSSEHRGGARQTRESRATRQQQWQQCISLGALSTRPGTKARTTETLRTTLMRQVLPLSPFYRHGNETQRGDRRTQLQVPKRNPALTPSSSQ